jgi:MtN3 and saliva related transmembrane protein
MTMGQELVGWVSSLILCLTIAKQIHTQWKEDTSRGVSSWLYLGQIFSSTGFVIYSVLVANWVFVVTNSALFVANILGLLVMRKHRARARAERALHKVADRRQAS